MNEQHCNKMPTDHDVLFAVLYRIEDMVKARLVDRATLHTELCHGCRWYADDRVYGVDTCRTCMATAMPTEFELEP